MKKALSILILVFISFTVFSSNTKICIYPSNEALLSYINEYFDVDLVNCNINCNQELLLTGDIRLMEYISNNTGADLLLLPIVEQLADYNYLRLYSYSNDTKEFCLEFESINKEDNIFSFDAVKSIYNHYFKVDEELVNIDEVDRSLVKTISTHSLKIDSKNSVASIFLNDMYIGQTPLTLDSYYVPSVVKFCSKGFADRVYSLNDLNLQELSITMIPLSKADSDSFKKSQNKYFASFAATIIGWGSRIFVSSLNIKNSNLKKALNIASFTLAISSTTYLGYNIYDYFKSTQNTTP